MEKEEKIIERILVEKKEAQDDVFYGLYELFNGLEYSWHYEGMEDLFNGIKYYNWHHRGGRSDAGSQEVRLLVVFPTII